MILDRRPHEWLEHWLGLTDDELIDERFALYDVAEVAEPDSDLGAFARWALSLIACIERLRSIARSEWRDVDASAFTTAFVAIGAFARELDSVARVAEVVEGALEVAQRREMETRTRKGSNNR